MNDPTKQAILEMLTENTGRNFLDSGGIPKYDADGKYIGSTQGYGRAFERSAGLTIADLDARPSAVLDASYGELSVTLDLYHYLVARLDYEPELTRLFAAWSSAREDTSYLEDLEAFPYMLARWSRYEDVVDDWATIAADHWESYDDEAALVTHEEALSGILDCAWINRGEQGDGIHPDPVDVLDGIWGDTRKPLTVNTYNEENALSQDIQFTMFGLDAGGSMSGPFVLLQIHGGADARGGYTLPRVFSFNGRFAVESFFDWGRVGLRGQDIDTAPYWTSDDAGYSYHAEIKRGEGAWTTLHIDPVYTLVMSEVPADIAPAVARVVAAFWRGDQESLIPTELHPDLFGGESPMVVGEYPPDVKAALDYLSDECPGGYELGDFALVTDDDGNAYCPVTGGKLEAWGW